MDDIRCIRRDQFPPLLFLLARESNHRIESSLLDALPNATPFPILFNRAILLRSRAHLRYDGIHFLLILAKAANPCLQTILENTGHDGATTSKLGRRNECL